MKRQKQGSTIVFAAIFTALFTAVAGSYMTVISSSSVGTARIAEQQKAYYAAEAGAYRLLSELNNSGRTSVSGTLATRTYRGNYVATYNNIDTITSTGTVNSMNRTVVVKVFAIPASIRAAFTANGNVRAQGKAVLDGRTYNSSGAVVSQRGVYGVSATGRFNQSGHSLVGGNGFDPARPANPNAYEQHAPRFSSTQPWDLLGVSRAWFTLNVPLRNGLPPEGFKGIWYTSSAPRYGTARLNNVEGILVVHNEHDNATLRKMSGTFKGLIIADRVRKLGSDSKIYGAVIASNQRGRSVGTGRALVAYSPQILSSLGTLLGGQNRSWKKTLQAATWQESGGRSSSNSGDTSLDPNSRERYLWH